ncbi:MAG: hypothetical protein ACT4NT_02350 [Nitrososphaerota archaeon]
MKYFVWFFTASILFYTINLAFAAQENLVPDANQDFPESIKIGEKVKFSLRMSNPQDYPISDIEPVIEILPKSASKFVHVEINPQISTLWDEFYEITQGTIYVDEDIPVDRIFVSVSFMGKNPYGEQVSLASVSTFNASIKIEKESEQSNESIFDYTNKVRYRIISETSESDIFYNIQGGTVEKIKILSDGSLQIDTSMKQDGILSLDIPKKTWFLADESCDPVGTVVLVDGKEYGILNRIDNDPKRYGYSEVFTKVGRTVEIKLPSNAKTIEFAVVDLLMGIPTSWQLGQQCLAMPQIDSPLKQFKSGVPVDQIQCKDRFVVAIKTSNNNPTCVKQETLQKLRERGWAEPLGNVVFQKPSKVTESTVSCPNQNMCTVAVEGVILKSMPDRHESTYYFFTNDNIGSIKTGATGIPLEINQDKMRPTDLHGKVVKLKGQMFLEPFSKIFVDDLQIVRDLIPTLSYNITDALEIEQSDGKTEMVTMNELFQNPAKYYWKQVSVKGLLKERGAVGIPAIECININFEESQEFRFEAFRSPYVLEGIVHDNNVAVEARLGIRLESGEEYKFIDWERLPPDLKDKNIVVNGMFRPTVSNSGICKAVLHPAGYILTTFDKITIAD